VQAPPHRFETQEQATWGLDRIDQRALPMDGLYNYRQTGKGVIAYIVDTGIRYTHQEFGGRATPGFDAFNDGQNGNDCQGHGTHVAGTVGGAKFGVAKQVQLVAVRVLGCDGSGATSGVVAGMDWVVGDVAARRANGDPVPAVANLSLGSLTGNASTDNAVRRMLAAGVTTVLAAGNGIPSGGVPQDACNASPARTREALTIGATTRTDGRTTWSNFGDCVDFFAPGASITAASWANDTDSRSISGTSMAAPHVAGAAALYLERNKRALPATVNQALIDATTKGVVTTSLTANNHLLFTGSL
jgi:subtilisin family serine protease